MPSKTVTRAMDSVLRPFGFVRRGPSWNRRVAQWVDAIDVQPSPYNDGLAVNIGVVDPEVYDRCWGRRLPEFALAAHGTVTVRLGTLMSRRDRWFYEADFGDPKEVPAGLSEFGLPFVDRMHSADAMDEFLTSRMEGLLPFEALSLALIRIKLGRREDACAVLADKRPKVASPWVDRFAELRVELGCLR